MKKQTSILFLSFLLFSFITITIPSNQYRLTDDFSMKIKGSSNVHDWESTIESMDGSASVSVDESGNVMVRSCSITIPANSIKSSKGSRMDKKTMKALKEEEYPNITYIMSSFETIDKTQGGFTANVTGDLSVAGTTKTITIEVIGKTLDNDLIEISGKKDMKMTDFDIKPPTALLGTMRTKDEITIEFSVTLDPLEN